jgi:hypothetical protein
VARGTESDRRWKTDDHSTIRQVYSAGRIGSENGARICVYLARPG